MRSLRLTAVAAGVCSLAWLAVATGYGVAAADVAADPAPVDLGGETLPTGPSTDPGRPTVLAPGLWSATLEASLAQHFRYERRISGSTVHVGVVGAPRGTAPDGIAVTASVPDSEASSPTGCGDESVSGEYSLPQAVIGARVVVGDESGSTGEACRAAGSIDIEVSRGSSSVTEDLPYAIKIVEEAPVTGAADTAEEPDDAPSYTVPEPGEARALAGAASFAGAPRLDAADGPVTVRATVTEGENLLWRVPLAWGDLPVVRVDVPAAPPEEEEKLGFGGPDLSVHLVDPLRGRLRYVESGSDDSATGEYRVSDEGDSVLVAAGYPVRRVNGRLPGDYWVSLAVEPAPDNRENRDPVSFEVELTVEVTATDAKAPTYDGAVLAQDKGAGIEGYSPRTPFLVGEGAFSAVASGSPATDEDDASWLSGRRWTGIGLAVLSVGCLAGGAVRLRTRR